MCVPICEDLGKLASLTGMLRPDISCSVRKLSRQTASPYIRHWRGLQRLLRYMAGTIDFGFSIQRGHTNSNEDTQMLVGHSDADRGGDLERKISYAVCIFLVNGSPVGWKTKWQQYVGLLILESEWAATITGMNHSIFKSGIFVELGSPEAEIPWFCDNGGAIQTTSKVGFRGRTRPVDIAFKSFFREYLDNLFGRSCITFHRDSYVMSSPRGFKLYWWEK